MAKRAIVSSVALLRTLCKGDRQAEESAVAVRAGGEGAGLALRGWEKEFGFDDDRLGFQ
jgi:hypothetical protein